MKKIYRTKFIVLIVVLICIFLFNIIVYANSAPIYMPDYPSIGIFSVDENTPIEVLKENLLFDFTEEDDNTYSPKAKVSATYEMQNSSNEDISVHMAFPFIEKFSEFSPDDIIITANDEIISYDTYLGETINNSRNPFQEPENTDFNIEKIIKSITDKKYTANNFKENETGKLYRFNVSSTDDKINFAVSFDFNHEKTKIILNGFNRFERNDNNIRIASGVREEETMEIYVLGEDISFDAKGFTSGNLEKETDKFEYEIITEEIDVETFLKNYADYYLNKYAENHEKMTKGRISEIQLYNLYAESLDKYLDRNLGVCTKGDIMSETWATRIITLVYSVNFPQNSKKVISVSYKTKGTMDRRETVEPQFTYDYILNPASNWKGFKNLNIKIITPEEAPYIVNSSIGLNKEDNNVYTAYSEELPEEDFTFTLYSKEKITLVDRIEGYLNRTFGYFTPIIIGFVFLIIIIVIFAVVKTRKRNKE
jgi:hypothetical protein